MSEVKITRRNQDEFLENQNVVRRKITVEPHEFTFEVDGKTNQQVQELVERLLGELSLTVSRFQQGVGHEIENLELSRKFDTFPSSDFSESEGFKEILPASVEVEERTLKKFDVRVDLTPTTLEVVAYDESDVHEVLWNADMSYHIDTSDFCVDDHDCRLIETGEEKLERGIQ